MAEIAKQVDLAGLDLPGTVVYDMPLLDVDVSNCCSKSCKSSSVNVDVEVLLI